MHIDPCIVLGSAVVGLLVGMTGAGGGALMTPMLILLFSVKPSAAISSDLVAAVVMRPVGAGMHLRKGTVNRSLVGWMVLGSVPMAFLGAYLLDRRTGESRTGAGHEIVAHPARTVAIGMIGGVIVGMTSVGSGSLMIILIAASGLKYIGLSTTALGWTLCAMLLACGVAWLAYKRPWQDTGALGDAAPSDVRPSAKVLE
jgi:hypothetical protein